jgi:hypothetical protein
MKMTVFWDVAPCSLVKVYRRFRGVCCLHHRHSRRQSSSKFTNVSEVLAASIIAILEDSHLQTNKRTTAYLLGIMLGIMLHICFRL